MKSRENTVYMALKIVKNEMCEAPQRYLALN